ncbi:MAG TPA: glycosyltransferase family 87 protein [Candidatus Binatia bacterium]|nr:glycosyltransferase family 87 protein [Candidatus Binatia bacterium]
MLWFNAVVFVRTLPGIAKGYRDFTVFYTAGTILRHHLGDQLYDSRLQHQVQQTFTHRQGFSKGPLPYIHPPFEALIFVPFALLPYVQAFFAWNIWNLLALAIVAMVIRQRVPLFASVSVLEFVLSSLAFYPSFSCILHGQDSILLLLMFTLAFRSLDQGADFRAGGWLGLACIKFQFVVPLVLLYAIWSRKKILAGFAAVAAALAAISLAITGVSGMAQYPRFATHVAETPAVGGVPAEFLPNIKGLAMGWPGLSGDAGKILAAALSVLVFLLAAWVGRKAREVDGARLQFSLAVVVSGLVAWQTNAHDWSLLILPLVLVADYVYRVKDQPGFSLLAPTLPVLISPLWLLLWLVLTQANLIAVPLLWWAWKIGRELWRRAQSMAVSVSLSSPNQESLAQ